MRTSNLLCKSMHPVLSEKLHLDRANIMFLWNYTSFIIVLNKNSQPQPEKGRFILDTNLAAQNIEITFLLHDKDFHIIRPWVWYKNNFQC